MKTNKYYLILLFATIFTNAQTSIFDTSILHEIKITSINPDLWDTLDNNYANPVDGNIVYESVTVEIDGEVVSEVGLRQKGYSSNFSATSNKKPLKINFGKFVDGQEYQKLKKINLFNGFGDPALLKDQLAYNMFRFHGVPAPRVAHAKIYINNVYWGIYAIIEQVDKRFLKRNYADRNGNLWKNKDVSTLSWEGTNPDSYTFELQTNEADNDWTKFIDFVDFINNSTDQNFASGIEDIFDLDEFLRVLAIDVILNNWDSHIGHGRNWYLYHEPKTDKIHWIPWDYNFSFDRIDDTSDYPIDYQDAQKIFITRVLSNPDFKERYLNYVCEIIDVNFTTARLYPMLDAQLNLITPSWNEANNNMYTLENMTNAVNGDTWNGPTIYTTLTPHDGLKKYVLNRLTNINSDLSALNHTCTPITPSINYHDVVINEFMANNNSDTSIWLDQDDENEDWIELYNNTDEAIDLTNYFLSDTSSFIHKWEFKAGTIIPANGFLIVWSDKDIDQEGIHTKFDLSKKGEEIILSYLDGTIIDSVEYTETQQESETLSRIPNGTGDFINTAVTFNALNSTSTTAVQDVAQKIKFYPNPAKSKIFINVPFEKIIISSISGVNIVESSESSINIEHLAKGVYLLKIIKQNGSMIIKKMIKQ